MSLEAANSHKTVIVTGGSQGIGAGAVRAFLDRGYRVVANSRTITRSHRFETSDRLALVDGNIAEAKTAEGIVDVAMSKFGSIDVLVNNAGIYFSKPFIEYTIDDLRALISVNIDGFFFISQLAIKQMLSQKAGGSIVNITSTLVDGVNGLEFQDVLAKAGIHIPIVFMTGHGDIPMSVKAMKAGAIDFLPKPFRDQDMLDAVIRALEQDRKRRDGEKAVSQLRHLFESLTPREREVMALVISGLMNKQIAHRLEVSEITVKIHRGHVMKKMEARSLADLVRMAELLGIKRTN